MISYSYKHIVMGGCEKCGTKKLAHNHTQTLCMGRDNTIYYCPKCDPITHNSCLAVNKFFNRR